MFFPQCDRSCGRGMQIREVHCMQLTGAGTTVVVPPTYCTMFRPADKQLCNLVDCPARFVTHSWSQVIIELFCFVSYCLWLVLFLRLATAFEKKKIILSDVFSSVWYKSFISNFVSDILNSENVIKSYLALVSKYTRALTRCRTSWKIFRLFHTSQIIHCLRNIQSNKYF